MPTFVNTDGMNQTNMGIQGLRIYAQLWDEKKKAYADSLLDFGAVQDLSRNRESDENKLEAARNGIRETVKVLTTSFTDKATYTSANFADPNVRAVFEGAEALTALNDPTAKIFIRGAGGSVQARFIILRPGAPGTDSSLIFVPKVQIKGTEETESNGADPQRLGFEVTFLSDEAYHVPATVLADNPAAPYGVSALIEATTKPIEALHAMVDALIATA